jgi:phosphoserine phosphatase RsbU/P
MDVTLDNSPCYYFCFSDDGVLVSVNRTLCDRLGYTKAEMEQLQLDNLLTLPSRIFYQTHWFPLLKLQQTVSELFVTLVAKDKTFLPVLVNSVRKEANGQIVNECVGILISNRQKYEEELIGAKKAYEAALSTNAALSGAKEQVQEHAMQLDKSLHRLRLQNDELKQINKIVTHDLQEPIRKLLYYSEELQESAGESPAIIKNIARLQTVTNRLRTIVSGLQQYIWITELNTPFTQVDLNETLAAAKKQTEMSHAGQEIELHSDVLPVIAGNAEQLLAMLVQLLDNAVQFRKEGQPAVVHIRSVILEQISFQEIEERYLYRNYVRMTVTDNGMGFDPFFKRQIFELFYKINDSSGAGLGLALCKKVAEHHEGTITAMSEPGKGMTVTVTLPLLVNK